MKDVAARGWTLRATDKLSAEEVQQIVDRAIQDDDGVMEQVAQELGLDDGPRPTIELVHSQEETRVQKDERGSMAELGKLFRLYPEVAHESLALVVQHLEQVSVKLDEVREEYREDNRGKQEQIDTIKESISGIQQEVARLDERVRWRGVIQGAIALALWSLFLLLLQGGVKI